MDRSRFVSPVPDEFVCPLCENVLSYPNILEDHVGHFFCRKCILDWLRVQKNCPVDKDFLDETHMKPIGVLVKSVIAKLDVYCKFKKFGCFMQCSLETLEKHEKECKFSDRICKNCHLLYKDSDAHNCVFSLLVYIEDLKDENEALKAELLESRTTVRKASVTSLKKPSINSQTDKVQRKEINNNITSIGDGVLNYGKDSNGLLCKTFVINSAGIIDFLFFDDYSEKSTIFQYHPNGEFTGLDLEYAADAIGLSDSNLYLAHLASVNAGVLKIEAYDLNLKKKLSFEALNTYESFSLYETIDMGPNRIYLKMRSVRKGYHSQRTQTTYLIHVLDMKLNLLDSFTFNEPVNFYDIKVIGKFVFYYSKKADLYTFYIQSLDDKQLLNKIDMKIDGGDYGIDFDIGPNGNIFVLVKDESVLNEYDLDGDLVQTSILKVEPPVNKMRITEKFSFAIDSCKKPVLYLS